MSLNCLKCLYKHQRLWESKLKYQGVQKILTHLYKQTSVDWFELEAFAVRVSTVEVLFDLLQKKTFEDHLSFEAGLLTDSEQSGVRLFLLSIVKNIYIEDPYGDRDEIIRCIKVSAECELKQAQRRLKGFSLRLSLESQIATINWREFFHTCVADSQGVDEHVDALIVCLSRMSGLEIVTMTVSCLNESWATGFLQLYLAGPCLQSIRCTMNITNEGCSAEVHMYNHEGALR
ncbi:uncharacterized protein LOC134435297 [Engraulis encrasicolus]|uniref:uncharacterized protein LOC134435297 n=1 Tax=Engraulis encrasicolus TaxID=184585 RepID=UPI002FD053CB